MAELEPLEITWHVHRPDQFQLIYRGLSLERRSGDRRDAEQLADSLGFTLVSNVDHLARWVRHPAALAIEE